MKINCNSFGLGGKFLEYDLNNIYIRNKKYIINTRNPQSIQDRLNYLQLNNNHYGGYGENRKDIWKGTYLDETGGYIHLGIDINMGVGEVVRSPFDAWVLDRFTDKDTRIGWGGRLILGRTGFGVMNGVWKYPLLVLGHLNPKSLTKKRYVKKGDILGTIGHWPENGNTFWHLHVQAINHIDFKNFDGYGFKHDLKNNPDPFKVDW